MVSDVLAEAIPQIESYLKFTPLYSDSPEGELVDCLLVHMKRVLKTLDTPPGTEWEPAAKNNA